MLKKKAKKQKAKPLSSLNNQSIKIAPPDGNTRGVLAAMATFIFGKRANQAAAIGRNPAKVAAAEPTKPKTATTPKNTLPDAKAVYAARRTGARKHD